MTTISLDQAIYILQQVDAWLQSQQMNADYQVEKKERNEWVER